MARPIGWFRFPAAILQALQGLTMAVYEAAKQQPGRGELQARIDELERTRALWEADMQGRLLKLDSQYKSVRAAEERVRQATRKLEGEEDDEADETDAAARAYFQAQGYAPNGAYDPAGEAGPVPPMHPRVADSTAARARKWGRA